VQWGALGMLVLLSVAFGVGSHTALTRLNFLNR
jgi:hypothetical protein